LLIFVQYFLCPDGFGFLVKKDETGYSSTSLLRGKLLNHRATLTNHQSLITDYRSLITDHRSQITRHYLTTVTLPLNVLTFLK
jgi:hypothetical protein